MLFDFDSVLEATSGSGGSVGIISENHDMSRVGGGECHAFATTDGRVSFVSSFRKAWHGLGIVTTGLMTWDEAIRLGGLTWQANATPVTWNWEGSTRTSPDSFVIVRSDTGQQLGIVGSKYSTLQNSECFEHLAKVLLDQIAWAWPKSYNRRRSPSIGQRVISTRSRRRGCRHQAQPPGGRARVVLARRTLLTVRDYPSLQFAG